MSQSSEPENDFDWYLQYRIALEQVKWEFEKLAGLAPNLYHRVFYSPDNPLDSDSWSAFIQANRDNDNWECWEQSQNGLTCGCFFGEQKHLEQFKRLAQSGYDVLSKLTFQMDRDSPVPTGVNIDLPSLEGHLGWLVLLHDTADFGTALLKERLGFWQLPEARTEEDVHEPYLHVQDANGDCRYPAHPFFRELQHDLFRSSVEAINIWFLADQAVSIGDYLGDPPIALPGVETYTAVETPIADYLLSIVNQSSTPEPTQLEGGDEAKPTWDGTVGQLRVGQTIIRRYKNKAKFQTNLLQKFQQAGWPAILDDPFEIGKISSRHEATIVTQKRRGVVDQLNKGQDQIDFGCDYSGKAVTWTWRAKAEIPLIPPKT